MPRPPEAASASAGHGRVWLPEGRTAVMGILNVTPDSFYDGARHVQVEAAVTEARRLIAEGADLVDVGGESSRPGAAPVSADEECARVVPVLTALRGETDRPISIDTTKAAVAAAALDAGVDLVNDVSAGRFDPAMLPLVAARRAGIVLMHMQGTPATMQAAPYYEDVVGEVRSFLAERAAVATAAGIDPARIWIDPGFGFGKRPGDNFDLLAHLEAFGSLGFPVVVGASRKRFLGSGDDTPGDRLFASLAAATLAAAHGAAVIRAHDVAATRRAVAIADAVGRASRSAS